MKIDHIFKLNRSQLLFVLIFPVLILGLVKCVHPGETVQTKKKEGFLWLIERGDKNAYLFGSIHILPSQPFPLSEVVENAYRSSKMVVFEADLDGLNDPNFQAKVNTLGLLPYGETIVDYISEETYGLLKIRVAELNLSMAQFERLRPWLCAVSLLAIKAQTLGFDLSNSVDRYFLTRAKQDEKELYFLESVEDHLRVFFEMNRIEQESLLLSALLDLESSRTRLWKMINAWTSGDVDKLDSSLRIEYQEYPDIYNRIILVRNKKWLSQIENMLEKDSHTLIIVGAAHLVGSGSILELLKNKGYSVRQE